MPAAKVRAVESVLLLVCPPGAACNASELLPLPASVSSQRQVGSAVEPGAKVLQSIASVVFAAPGPYTFSPICPLAVVVICMLVVVMDVAAAVPLTSR